MHRTPQPARRADAPSPPGPVPPFAPVLPRGGRHRLRRVVRRRRRALAASLAVTAAALAAAVPREGVPARTDRPARAAPAPAEPPRPPAPAPGDPLVTAPVRIADADAVRQLSPGDLVDVLASPQAPAAESRAVRARRVAHRARVADVPAAGGSAPGSAAHGALVMLSVTPATAAALAGAASNSRLAVTRW